MKTVYSSWVDSSNKWYNSVSTYVDPLYDAFQEAENAMTIVANARDIGSLSINLTFSEIEELNEKRRKFVSFCNGIHYEISQLVDNPFSVRISKLLDTAYALNPSDYKVKTGKILWWDTMTSLKDLMSSTTIDKELKQDFVNRFQSLDKDEIPTDLKDVIKDAQFWEGEFKKSNQCQEIATQVFTKEIRANWASMPYDEKKSVIETYVNQISKILFNESKTPIVYDAPVYGESSYKKILIFTNRKISINPNFISDATANYCVDKIIDTLTHETRHQYQEMVKQNPKKYGISDSLKNEWNAAYISYNQDYTKYYHQEIERDARSFAALSSSEE